MIAPLAAPSLLQRIDLWLRCITPVAITLLLALLPLVPLNMPLDFGVVPAFTLMSVYYWTIYRPDLMPVGVIFLIGVAQDLLAGGPLGLTALILVGTYAVIVTQRRTFLNKPFPLAWGGFLVTAVAATVVSWLVASLLAGHTLELSQAFMQLLVTFLIFPLLVWFFVRTHRRVLGRV
jgi:rod shape-determining protein MreD